MIEKRPRQYAAEIAELPTREERAAALARVPQHLQALTAEHVKTVFESRKRAKETHNVTI